MPVMANQKTLLLDFIRHGEPEGGDILRGRVDPQLTPLGWQQMRSTTGLTETSPHRHTPPWSHIVSSPLRRCSDFARAAADILQLNASLTIDEAWLEIDYGDWDGMPIAEWHREAAGQFRAFRTDMTALAPPNGEAYVDFRDRILAAWQALGDYPDGSHVLVVTHGGVLRVILPTVLGMPLNASFPLHIPFASFSRIQLNVEADKISASLLFHNAADYPLTSRV